MKKIIATVISVMLLLTMLVGCGKETATPGAASNSPAGNATQSPSAETMTGDIHVISREQGSGTRGAFIELFGIEQENEDGEKIDYTTELAEETNSTAVMITTVAGNKQSIGYISLGSLDETVKAVKIDGVEASVDNVNNGTYKVVRPFNIATQENVSPLAQDFINFIMSDEGQAVISEGGYISVAEGESYTASNLSGTITVAGSSSVTPIMQKLRDAYNVLNPDVTIEVQQNDSTTGMNSAIEGICEIGMASRELKDSEIEAGLKATVIAQDGIAVVVNNDNPTENLTSEQVRDIFMGEITEWDALN